MKKSLLLCSVVATLSLPGLAQACSAPDAKPAIPDPSTAETAQMVKANNEVKAYVAAMEEYLGCARMSGGEKRREISALEDFAAEFNEAIRAFKSRNS